MKSLEAHPLRIKSFILSQKERFVLGRIIYFH